MSRANDQIARAMEMMTMAMQQQNAYFARMESERAAAGVARPTGSQESQDLAEFRKRHPPQFKGDADPEVADHWIYEMEKIFIVQECSQERRLAYVVYMLVGEAEHWWRGRRWLIIPQIKEELLISVGQAESLLRDEAECCLLLAAMSVETERVITEVDVGKDFAEVFPDGMLGLPPVREMEFSIDLVPCAGPISVAPYRMAPAELVELKGQLEDLLEKQLACSDQSGRYS